MTLLQFTKILGLLLLILETQSKDLTQKEKQLLKVDYFRFKYLFFFKIMRNSPLPPLFLLPTETKP